MKADVQRSGRGDFGRPDRQVCIIGLGPVGLSLAVVMAEAGFQVRGVERDARICDLVNAGQAPFGEAGLEASLAPLVASGALTAGATWPARGESDVFVITVGTPLSQAKRADLSFIRAAAGEIAGVLSGGELVVLRSTVRIGVSRSAVADVLDRADAPYHLAFCPERAVEGRVLAELRTLPQIVGGRDDASAGRAALLFSRFAPAIVQVGSLEAAEAVKLVNNSQRDLMFAFANEVAEVCEVAGLSAAEVIGAANRGYPRGATPMPGPAGGPCLEKDPYILAESGLSESGFGGAMRLPLLGRRINEALPDKVADRLAGAFAGRAAPRKLAVAGLAFKGRPSTADLRGSLAIPLIAALRARFPAATIVGFDPAAPAAEIARLGIAAAATAEAAFTGADVVVFQTNHADFQALDLAALSARMRRGAIVYDLWSQFDGQASDLRNGVKYRAFGGWTAADALEDARVSLRMAAVD